jgi:hypothetical protein
MQFLQEQHLVQYELVDDLLQGGSDQTKLWLIDFNLSPQVEAGGGGIASQIVQLLSLSQLYDKKMQRAIHRNRGSKGGGYGDRSFLVPGMCKKLVL